MISFASEFGRRICKLRVAANLSQQELADRIGICRSALSKYELAERHPTTSRIKQIADALGVPVGVLFGDCAPPSMPSYEVHNAD
jgi:transcriptional regulator with XRE-family HTH domain